MKTNNQEFVDMNFQEVKNISDIPKNKYLIYALSIDGKYIVLGRGKYNRAKVIFDNIDQISYNHIKSLKIRLYHLFGSHSNFKREIVITESIEHAKDLEKEKHKLFGGNSLEIDSNIIDKLFKDLKNDSRIKLFLEIAVTSRYSGLNDLRRWYKEQIISEAHWQKISNMLQLPTE